MSKLDTGYNNARHNNHELFVKMSNETGKDCYAGQAGETIQISFLGAKKSQQHQQNV